MRPRQLRGVDHFSGRTGAVHAASLRMRVPRSESVDRCSAGVREAHGGSRRWRGLRSGGHRDEPERESRRRCHLSSVRSRPVSMRCAITRRTTNQVGQSASAQASTDAPCRAACVDLHPCRSPVSPTAKALDRSAKRASPKASVKHAAPPRRKGLQPRPRAQVTSMHEQDSRRKTKLALLRYDARRLTAAFQIHPLAGKQ